MRTVSSHRQEPALSGEETKLWELSNEECVALAHTWLGEHDGPFGYYSDQQWSARVEALEARAALTDELGKALEARGCEFAIGCKRLREEFHRPEHPDCSTCTALTRWRAVGGGE